MIHDLRYAARSLRRSPALTAVAVLTLAVGIGANTAIFSWVKAVIVKPLPGVPRSDELVMVVGKSRGGQTIALSYPDYRDYRDRNEAFSGLSASAPASFNLSHEERADRVWGELVSGNYFQVLGVRAQLGRVLGEQDERRGDDRVVVISQALWKTRFGSDAAIVGRSIRLNGHPFTIVGVAAPHFLGSMVGVGLDLFIPLTAQAVVTPSEAGDALEDRNWQWLIVLGRLREGAALDRSETAMRELAVQLEADNPERDRGRSVQLFPLWRAPFGAQPFLVPVVSALMAVVGLVLLIACANVANLLLARAAGRRREIAVRLALGAWRSRLIRQLLTESLLLSGLGAVAGLLLTFWMLDGMSGFRPPTTVPIVLDTNPDGTVLAFTLGITILSGLLFGLAPALQSSKPELVPALKDEGSARGRRRSRLLGGLVVLQVGLSLVALIGAGLILRSLRNAKAVDPGFDPNGVLLAALDLRPGAHTAETGLTFYRRLLSEVTGEPGAESASLGWLVPLDVAGNPTRGVSVEGYEAQPDEEMVFAYNIVGPDYFRTLGIALVSGREFGTQDDERARDVAIVNETFARRYWPDQDPVGRRLSIGERTREVIGVVRDIKYLRLAEDPQPYFYLPVLQNYRPQMTLHVRTSGAPGAFGPPLAAVVQRLDPGLTLFHVRTLSEHMGVSVTTYSMAATMLGAFGLVALLLAAVGIYGVVAYTVGQRTREVGIRMTLGARKREVLRLVVGQGMVPVAIGVGVGLAGAVAVTRLLSGLLLGVGPTDPLTLGGVSLFLAAIGLLACYLPARRVARIDPVEVLRHE